MMIVKTETSSIYEIDMDAKRMRRVSGAHEPTRNQGEDGTWREYQYITPVEIGANLMVVWGLEQVEEELILRRTLTSRIEEVEQQEMQM